MHYAIKGSHILSVNKGKQLFSTDVCFSFDVILKVLCFSGTVNKGTTSIFVNFLEESLVKCHLLSPSHLEFSKLLLFKTATIKTMPEDHMVP